MLLESGNVCFLLLCRDVNNLYPLHRSSLEVKEIKLASYSYFYYILQRFSISMLVFAQQIDYLKSMTHFTMPFHLAQLMKIAFLVSLRILNI